ncbi:hypothetical protein DFP93_12069 [Aneurinibacillus soli]|uniref:Uncharacterized protein n=1 Tax=Aneurinibacillus soli TaxID=1500254 RepID=A0A0U4WAT1_9BACL|nr:hypothetical protein DFP93_12069 [Aneurinibacillus soli]BAU26008.1 hypothetical protein CB4_00080 [Aneurinibacillus soli]
MRILGDILGDVELAVWYRKNVMILKKVERKADVA